MNAFNANDGMLISFFGVSSWRHVSDVKSNNVVTCELAKYGIGITMLWLSCVANDKNKILLDMERILLDSNNRSLHIYCTVI